MSQELISMYEANKSRLEGQVRGMRVSLHQYNYILGACVLLSPFGLFLHWIVSLAVLLLGCCIWGVGRYLAFVHMTEDSIAIAEADERLKELRGAAPPDPRAQASATE